MRAATAKSIAEALAAHRAGSCWMAKCPAHDDATPSLSISERDHRLLVFCHAGCSQAAVIAALRERGLWAGSTQSPEPALSRTHCRDEPRQKRTARALKIWCETIPATNTTVEAYLRSRGITGPVPRSLRMHAALRHRSGVLAPAMVALVTKGDANRAIGIHRTWLSPNGSGKAPITPNKMMLGQTRGGAVRLGPVTVPLLVGEGIETCLSAMPATGHSAWAAMSTSGLRALELPHDVRDVIVLADGDPPGEAAAQAAAARWAAEGRRVRIARAPEGQDFNDLLLVVPGEMGGANG